MSQARDLGDAANKVNFLDNVNSDIQTQINQVTPAGTIITFGGTSAPTGFLACEGQSVLQSDYPALYAAIGTTWGTPTNPAAYFKLPDLRGAFLRGTGSHGTENMANGSDFAGQAVGSFEADQMQGHQHDIAGNTGTGRAANAASAAGSFLAGEASDTSYMYRNDSNGSFTSMVGDPVADASHGTPRTGDETRPFNAGILYCIAIGSSTIISASAAGGNSDTGGSAPSPTAPASTTSTASHANLMSSAGELLVNSAGEAITTATVVDTVQQINTKLGGL